MKISVIMVCFNASATIEGAIASFLAQDYPERELLVVDGASTDGTAEIARGFDSPLISVESAPDRGIYDAMNKGLARVTGDAFGFLNADDRFHDDTALSRLAAGLARFEIVTGDLRFVSAHDGSPAVRVWPAEPYEPGAFRRGWTLAHPSTYARRTVLERTGMFEPSYRIGGDYDWLLRALEIDGARHGCVEGTVVDMAVGGVSTSGFGSKLRIMREMRRARRERLGVGVVDAALVLAPLRKITQFRPSFAPRRR